MEAADKTLEQLNAEEAKSYTAAAIFVGILMVLGFVGNIHVLYVFKFKRKASNHRIFILCLAVMDTVTCGVGMPFALVEMANPLTFTMDVACKIFQFITYFMCCGSVPVLMVIAVDRYRKICRPLEKQMSSFWARVSVAISLGITLAFTWPAFVLFGHSTVPTTLSNLTGVRCWAEDNYKDTNYLLYMNIVLFVIALGVFIFLSVIYTLIGKVILKQNAMWRRGTGSNASVLTATFPRLSSEADGKSAKSQSTDVDRSPTDGETPTAVETRPTVSTRQNPHSNGGATEAVDPSKTQSRWSNKDNSTMRMTLILFLITAVFFISFIPYLVLMLVTFLHKSFVTNLTQGELVVYSLFLNFFFVNSAANPFIYGFCDLQFREAVRDIYRGIFRGLRDRKNNMCLTE